MDERGWNSIFNYVLLCFSVLLKVPPSKATHRTPRNTLRPALAKRSVISRCQVHERVDMTTGESGTEFKVGAKETVSL